MSTTTKDHAWGQGMYEDLVAVHKEMGGDSVFSFKVFPKVQRESAIPKMVKRLKKEGYNFFIFHASSYENELYNIAAAHPELSFAIASPKNEEKARQAGNVFVYSVACEQAGYVNGVLAGLALDFAIVGMVVPDETFSPDVTEYVDGFRNGLKSVSPVSDVIIAYSQSGLDVNYAREAAGVLLIEDANIFTGITPQALGALHIAEDNELFWLGAEGDHKRVGPNATLASQVFRWKPTLKDMLYALKNGDRGAKFYHLDYANEGIETVYNGGLELPNETKALVTRVVTGMKEGYINPLKVQKMHLKN